MGETSLKRGLSERWVEIDEESSSGMFGYKKMKTESRTEISVEDRRQCLNEIDNRMRQYEIGGECLLMEGQRKVMEAFNLNSRINLMGLDQNALR